MTASDRLGRLLATPGILLACAIVAYLFFAKAVCDPLYQRNQLLDFDVLTKIRPDLAAGLGGPISPPSREGLAFHRMPDLLRACSSPR